MGDGEETIPKIDTFKLVGRSISRRRSIREFKNDEALNRGRSEALEKTATQRRTKKKKERTDLSVQSMQK